MVRPTKQIPFDNVKGLKYFIEKLEQKTITQEEIADYYSEKLGMKISQQTISNKIKELKKESE
jgi:arginine repressor